MVVNSKEHSYLECRGHEGVVDAGLGEEGEVDVEAAEVQRHWDGQHERGSCHKLLDQLQCQNGIFKVNCGNLKWKI